MPVVSANVYKLYHGVQKIRTSSLTSNGQNSCLANPVRQKRGLPCQWFGNVDMHIYTKFDQYISFGSGDMNIFTYCQ